MATPVQVLLDSVKDGMLVVNLAGKLMYCNESARQMFNDDLLSVAGHATIKDAILKVATGKLILPAPLRLELKNANGGSFAVSGTLVQANAHEYGFVVEADPGSAAAGDSLADVLRLLREELKGPIQKLSAALRGRPEVRVVAEDVVNRLDKLVDLVDTFGDDALVGDERILIKDLVTAVWEDVAPLAAKKRMEASLVGFHQDLPPVYGSHGWLRRAVRECLENAVMHAREDIDSRDPGHIEIRAVQSGQHLLLTVRNLGVGVLPKLADRVFLPFNRAGQPKSHPSQGMSIGLPLCKRIVELHGGQLKIQHREDDSTELTLQLPTGGSRRENAKLDMQQAQRYAEDLAKLMARRRAKPGATAGA